MLNDNLKLPFSGGQVLVRRMITKDEANKLNAMFQVFFKEQATMVCGDANPKGNVKLIFKGGCDRKLKLKDAYRCTGCGGWFHKECILKHFEQEKDHDWGRKDERERIAEIVAKMKHIGLIIPENPPKINLIDKDELLKKI